MTTPLSIRMDEATRKALQTMADTDGRTLSNYVAHVLRQHVVNKRNKAQQKARHRQKAKDNEHPLP